MLEQSSATLWPAGDGAIARVCLGLAAAGLSPLAPARPSVHPGSWSLQTEPNKCGTHYSGSHSLSQPRSGTQEPCFPSLLFLFIIFLAFLPHPLETGLPGDSFLRCPFSSFSVPKPTAHSQEEQKTVLGTPRGLNPRSSP